jgi:class 3 adenylate cyclase
VAKPGTVVVGENTYRLAEGRFDFRSLGSFSLKGKEREVLVYGVASHASEDAPSSPSGAGEA